MNPISRLNEICQVKPWNVTFTSHMEGPSHCPIIRVIATLTGQHFGTPIVVEASANRKQDAKSEAARMLVEHEFVVAALQDHPKFQHMPAVPAASAPAHSGSGIGIGSGVGIGAAHVAYVGQQAQSQPLMQGSMPAQYTSTGRPRSLGQQQIAQVPQPAQPAQPGLSHPYQPLQATPATSSSYPAAVQPQVAAYPMQSPQLQRSSSFVQPVMEVQHTSTSQGPRPGMAASEDAVSELDQLCQRLEHDFLNLGVKTECDYFSPGYDFKREGGKYKVKLEIKLPEADLKCEVLASSRSEAFNTAAHYALTALAARGSIPSVQLSLSPSSDSS